MNKIMLIAMLMLSLLSVSCNESDGGSDQGETTDLAPITEGEGSHDNPTTPGSGNPAPGVPALALSFGANVELLNFTATQAQKYEKAIELVKLVVATEEFKTRVLSYRYDGATQYANNRNLSNAQIYQSILEAAETLRPTKNNRMDLEVELYYENSSVVGYTNGSTTQIWVNTKFFNQYEPNSVAGNLFHEWLHKLGYGHDSASTSARPHSVPYAIGYIMADIAQDFL